MNALLSVTPIIVESARLSLLNIKQQACPSILFKLVSKSFQNCSLARLHEVHRAIVAVYVYVYVRVRVTLSVIVFYKSISLDHVDGSS